MNEIFFSNVRKSNQNTGNTESINDFGKYT